MFSGMTGPYRPLAFRLLYSMYKARAARTGFALCAMAPMEPPDEAPVSSWWSGCEDAVESFESLATWSVMSVEVPSLASRQLHDVDAEELLSK